MPNEVAFELLLGRPVTDVAGESLGRLQEVVAEHEGDELLVRGLCGLFGGADHTLTVPWDAMDLSDPSRPRCTLRRAEVERLTAELTRGAGGVASGR